MRRGGGIEPEPNAAELPGGVEAVQDAALNGAQVKSLLEMVTAVVLGQLPAESARAMIVAAFPTLDQETINAIVTPAAKFTPDPLPGKADGS